MTCALCLENTPLQNSHIIPEFLYGAMYDDRHRFLQLSLRENERDRLRQGGAKEKLLCRDCEISLSKLERYASRVIKGGARGISANKQGDLIFVAGIDYNRFKLFLLSLLWRAGVSKNHFFEDVDLGPHAERLRKMLLADDPGPFNLYPCIIFGLRMAPDKISSVMMKPGKSRSLGRVTYHFVLPGLRLDYFVSSTKLAPPHNQLALQENGSFVFSVHSVFDLPSLRDFMQQYEQRKQQVGRVNVSGA